jgi:hypothetical protein
LIASIVVSANPVKRWEQFAQSFSAEQIQNVRFEHRDIGGDWSATFEVHPRLVTRALADDFLNNGLGRQVEIFNERGIRDWIGYIHSVSYQRGGNEVMSSLDDMANQLWVRHDAGVGVIRGGTYSDSLSQARYGIKVRVLIAGQAPTASANLYAQKDLKWIAWPVASIRSINPGAKAQGQDTLLVKCLGYWHTLGWRVHNQTAIGGTANASTVVDDALDVAEFMRTQTIETNTFSVNRTYDSDRYAMEVIASLVEAGNASSDRMVAGITGERDFYYRSAASVTGTVKYAVGMWDPRARIYDSSGAAIAPNELRPDNWIKVEGMQLPRGVVYDNHIEDPSTTYIVGMIYDGDTDTVSIKTDRNQFAEALLKRLAR